MDNNLQKDSPIFIKDSDDFSKKIEPVVLPQKNIGIDTENTIYDNIVGYGEQNLVDLSLINSFSNTARSRNEIFNLIDTMAEDSTVLLVLETYLEDATEYSDEGKIVWAESSDANIQKFVTYLLDSLNVDKHIYKWLHCLCKYGDVYLRLYRESEYDDPIFSDKADKEKKNKLNELLKLSDLKYDDIFVPKEELTEAVIVKAYKDSDKYLHYVEMVPNPANCFELTRFGKTSGYILTSVEPQMKKDTTFYTNYNYNFNRSDVEVYGLTEFVHACLDDSSSRTSEKVTLFMDNSEDGADSKSYSYSVKRGQSLLYNVFKIWRERNLLKDSVLLNRVTKSSIVRLIQVEVGDMPKEKISTHLNKIKQLIEQKTSLNTNQSMGEYTNPGPIENNVYVPSHGGIGAISTQQVGGDVDVKSLADLDHFDNDFFGLLRVPKQFFGNTDDGLGFNGGQSLSIISSRYAKMVKRIQNLLVQMLTDCIHLMLIDLGLDQYINKFTIKMTPPITQDELDRRDSLSNKISILSDIMNNLSDIEDPILKLRLVKSLMLNTISNGEIIDIIQEAIDDLELEQLIDQLIGEEVIDQGGLDDLGNMPLDVDTGEGSNADTGSLPLENIDIDIELPSGGEELLPEESLGGDELPSPSDLGIDFTDNGGEF